MNRSPFPPRTLVLKDESIRERAIAVIRNLPIDSLEPLQIVVSDYKPPRKKSQNDLMWAGPLKDMEEQAYLEQRRYSAKVWAEYFKEQFLPEEFDAEYCRVGYVKWEDAPNGTRKLVGSTTQLTVKGFALYLEQIYAFGSNLGVQFTANPNEGNRP